MATKVVCSSCRHPMLVDYGSAMDCPSCGEPACHECFNSDLRMCQVCMPDKDPEEEEATMSNELKIADAFGVSVDDLVVRPKKTIDPLGDCVIFKAVDPERTAAGLYVPDKVETAKRAIVVAVGPGKMLDDGTRRPMTVQPGDWIVLWLSAASPGGTTHTGETLYMCREEDVAARILVGEKDAAS